MKYSPLHLLFLLLLTSCATKQSTPDSTPDGPTQTYTYADSCEHLLVSLSLELPTGLDSASCVVRDALLADFVRSVTEPIYSDDNNKGISPIDSHNPQDIIEHYGREIYRRLLSMAQSDYNDRIAYLDSDTTMTEEERDRIRAEVPQWNYTFTTQRTDVASSYIVYDSQIYCYYGGAHGGVTGTGPMTFDLHTGHKIEHFFRPDVAIAMQPLLRRGLQLYYSWNGETISDAELNEHLQIEGSLIPLPQHTPCPNHTGDSLTLTYGQYEIACYADGMPSFKVAVKDVASFLTPEAQKLLIEEK